MSIFETLPWAFLMLIAILAAPGSGELWLRKLVEQLLGYYTGSTVTNSTHQYFVGDGVTDKVTISTSFLEG